ncbi:MAG: hypothetical protein RID91_20690 [Azospirillaceae bacterium]
MPTRPIRPTPSPRRPLRAARAAVRAPLFAAGAAGLVAAASAGLVAPAPAAAQATEARADEIRLMIKRFIAESLAGQPDMAVVLDLPEPIGVAPAGDGYAATIPAGRAMVRSKGGEGAIVGFDAIGIDITETERGWLDMVFAVPGSVRVLAAEVEGESMVPSGDAVTVTAAKRRLDVTVAPDWGFVMAADIAFGDLVANLEGTPARLAIGAIEATQRSEPVDGAAPDVFDQTLTGALRGVSFVDPEGAELLTLEEAGLDSRTDAMRPAEIVAVTDRLSGLQDELAAAGGPGADAEALMAELTGVVTEMPLLLAGGQGAYTLSGLTIDAEGTRVTIDGARMGGSLTGLDGAASTVGLTLGVDGFAIDPEPEEAAGFVPRRTALELRFVDLPNEALRENLIGFLQTAMSMGPEMAGPMALGQLQAALMQGGASIRLDDLTVVTDETALGATGAVVPAPSSPFMVAADAMVEIAGLDALVTRLKGEPAAEDALPVLTMLQAMGQQATAEDGTPVRRYDLEFTEAGELTLNGADLGPLLDEAL